MPILNSVFIHQIVENMEISKIQNKIYVIRGQSVMLDFDLAQLYGTETRILKQTVKRNKSRFPTDFMFELTLKEIANLTSQNVISSSSWGGRRYKPYAFTEQGVAMLASILQTPKAIRINISIVRAFVMMRRFALSHAELSMKVEALELKYNKRFKDIDAVLYFLMTKDNRQGPKSRNLIGFKTGKKE